MRIMIVVTHLLGTGHLSRALVLGRAFASSGHGVTLVSGGMPATHLDDSGIDFVQLPPLRSDGVNFARLLDETGVPASQDVFQMRKQLLCDTLDETNPDAIITELFPFGRRSLSGEFHTLLKAAHQSKRRPVICASVRDILAPPSKPEKAMATQKVIQEYYDAVLVHSDPTVTPLENSWPVTPEISRKLHYTGFVCAPPAKPSCEPADTARVLVSTGGGNVAPKVYTAALDAAALSPDLAWRLLVAGEDATARICDLQAQAPENVLVSPANPAFRQMLYTATASISLCGYNTALDVLQARTPAVFIPFDDGGESEQTLRAQALSALDGVALIKTADLTPRYLLDQLHSVIAAPKRKHLVDTLEGAGRTVDIIEALVKRADHDL